ncbi:MAG: flagellar protein FlaG [Planctomycetota bacterium]
MMQLDNKLSLDDAKAGRDHRARANTSQEQTVETSPGTPTERAVAGGATPTSRPQHEPKDDEQKHQKDSARADEQRRKAEKEMAELLRLPADTRLDIDVDVETDEVRFMIRERRTGKLVREVPPEDAKPLMERLKEFNGALVDRSF